MDRGEGNSVLDSNLDRRGFLIVSCSGAVALSGLLLGGCTLLPKGPALTYPDRWDLFNNLQDTEWVEIPEKEKEEPLDPAIEEIVKRLSLSHKVAQLFIVRPEGITGVELAILAGDLTREALAKWPVGGLIYSKPNLIGEDQTKSLLAGTLGFGKQPNGIPPFLSLIEEGGEASQVGRNWGFYAEDVGDMADIGASNDTGLAKSTARYIAGYLKDLGFNLNLAPCCDIANNSASAMLKRSFGNTPERVTRMVEAQVVGFAESGLLCCAKHFPGIGGVAGDSQTGRITSNRTAAELDGTELVPFRAAIDVGVPLMMVGHLSLPAIAGDSTPASLSSTIIQGLLRDTLGYKGLVISDALDKGAITGHYSNETAAVLALKAGCDIVLAPATFESSYNSVLSAISRGEITEERVNQSVRRVLKVKRGAIM